jgi:exopolyphosphatase/guanosine-5'-triphosphate,3'-diphosphate pyrophosphatase
MRITRLGQGVDASHKLEVGAIERTVAVLSEFRRTMDDLGVIRGRLVATSAVRDAVNGEDFLSAAMDATGFPAELLSGEDEGWLAYAGATAGLPPSAGDDVVIDIGGGSTELVLGRAGCIEAVSLDLGCVRLTERYLRYDPPEPFELAASAVAIDAELDRGIEMLPGLDTLRPNSRLIGLAGTVSTVAALDQSLAEYDRDRIHHAVLHRAAITRWCKVLTAEPAAARAARTGMVPGRQDVIVGGIQILQKAMMRLGFDECLVSESDILDGMAKALLAPLP